MWIIPSQSWAQEPRDGIGGMRRDLELLREAGVNFVIPLAKGTDGRASYRSDVVPWHVFSKWDPLELLTRHAHELGLSVYPWFCVFPEGESRLVRVLRAHPDWAVEDGKGKRQGYADPAKPEARSYEMSVISEVLKKYEVDGVMLDYARYPGPDYCYCDSCCGQFENEYGVNPKNLPIRGELREKWDAWRRERVSSFVKELSEKVHATRPGAKLGSYCWTTGSLYNVYQDWPAWTRRGYLDLITPTGYVYDMDLFRSTCLHIKIAVADVIPTFVTIGVQTSHGKLKRDELIQQIRIAREEKLHGVTLFHWEALKRFLPELRRALAKPALMPS